MKTVYLCLRAVIGIIIGLYLESTTAEKHMILHMGLAVDKIYTVDGATVMSSYNQSHSYDDQWIMLVPPKVNKRFLIQFEHIDIPCPQHLTITEADINLGLFTATAGDRILNDFCGDMNDLFTVHQLGSAAHFIRTKRKGYGLHILWSAAPERPTQQQGIQLTVTAFSQLADCSSEDFVCKAMCINKDLVCDGFSHCLDNYDESLNCTQTFQKAAEHVPICLPAPCGGSSLQWQFHHNTLTLMVPMVLALIFLSLAILWRNKRILRRLLNDRRPTQRSAISFDSSEIATAEHETFYNAEIPEITGGDPPSFDPDWGIQLPPPYSPREDLQSLRFAASTQGYLPPPYETVVRESTQTSEASKTPSESVQESSSETC